MPKIGWLSKQTNRVQAGGLPSGWGRPGYQERSGDSAGSRKVLKRVKRAKALIRDNASGPPCVECGERYWVALDSRVTADVTGLRLCLIRVHACRPDYSGGGGWSCSVLEVYAQARQVHAEHLEQSQLRTDYIQKLKKSERAGKDQ